MRVSHIRVSRYFYIWSLRDTKFPQFTRTLFNILAGLNAVVLIVSTCPLFSQTYCPFINPFGIVPGAPIIIDITVTFMLLKSRSRSKNYYYYYYYYYYSLQVFNFLFFYIGATRYSFSGVRMTSRLFMSSTLF